MSVVTNQGDSINVVFVFQRDEQVEEVTLNSAQLTALLNSKQVWIEKFSSNLKIENTVWSYANNNVSMQIYLK
ncbi:hypothetical protein NSA56_14495 [Oceanobacillus caeni]|uniref:hypothetical protein n=1 Tax=Bacillaceae TaxID=186817 RepID=UPI00197F0010|nr:MULTISPECIES: hypothetical protein [Oceanobacillus]MBN6206136.1 hypothetical protein [Ralstonia pickettii]MBU8791569.1 hypothetical protein [Oceanobacillus caeni]MCR1835568.1 hypothetical protein [Oceanobacillus caeni]MCT1905500.1 hypothetical protein [Oceanobacillus sojae]